MPVFLHGCIMELATLTRGGVRNCAGFDTGFRKLEITSRDRENWGTYRRPLSTDGHKNHFLNMNAHSFDVEGDGGASGEPTDPEVDKLLRTREYKEVGHSQRPSHMDKILEHILLMDLQ